MEAEEIQSLLAVLGKVNFISGRAHANALNADLKDNLEASPQDPALQPAMQQMMDALFGNPYMHSQLYMNNIYPPLFERYEAGMSYGNHYDDMSLRKPELMRADLAITVFLSDPLSYDGGDVVIQMPSGDARFKLPAGSLLAYPPEYLHRVEPVTKGVRYAAVSWLESRLRNHDERMLLQQLDDTTVRLQQELGNRLEIQTLMNTYNQLLRKWSD